MSKFDLVIFDCDGTLVDSEVLNNIATAEVLAELGLMQFTPDYNTEAFLGKSQPEIWKLIETLGGIRLPDDINQRYIDRVAKNSHLYLKPSPGAADIVSEIIRTHKVCVASNGELPNVVSSVAGAGLSQFFPADQIFVAAMVPKPKPAPDLFLYAAARNNARPERTLVIEDSVVGASAGLAAGMTVFGYVGVTHPPEAQAEKLRAIGVHYVSDDLAEIADIIKAAEAA